LLVPPSSTMDPLLRAVGCHPSSSWVSQFRPKATVALAISYGFI
jgi:hypothetical protein